MSEKIWLSSYPPGIPPEVDLSSLASVAECAEQAFRDFGDHDAYVQMGRAITFRQLDALSAAFGAWLQQAGLKRGDRVALMMPNLLQYPIALFGALRAGFAVVNTNPLYTPPELEHQLADSGATAVVVLANFAHVLEQVLPRTQVRHVIVTEVGDLLGFPKGAIVNFVVRRRGIPAWRIPAAVRWREVLAAGARLTLDRPELTHDDLAFLQYTGGTTGVAKGAMLTHGNICANLLQALAWIRPFLPDATEKTHYLVTPIPLYHIFALTANCLVFMRLGWTNVLITNPRDFPAFVKELRKYPFAYLTGVNTLFNALMNTPGFDQLDFSHLKVTLGGGMAVQEAVATRWKEVTGKTLTQAWGLTETSPAACINIPYTDFNGSIGLPISSTDIAIKDDAGADLAVGEVGEICVRGPQVMHGYWNRPDETEKVMLPGEWLRTGDIGRMDAHGFVYIEDRKKDMILVSGFNVYPNEVEGVIAAHPGVREVAAVAQPDARAGEVVAVFVVRKDPQLTERDIVDWCRKSLTGYKLPRHVYFRDELPKTNVGKILRRALREQLPQA